MDSAFTASNFSIGFSYSSHFPIPLLQPQRVASQKLPYGEGNSHVQQVDRGVLQRPPVMGSVPYPRMYEETDMEAKIHQLEQEAYSSVLRAFKAQADAITWEKEGLLTELRRELRLSNEEHSALLSRVNPDETIRRISEWRKSGGHQLHSACQAVHDPVPSPSVSSSLKKQKIAPSLPSQSYGGPSPSFHPQAIAAANQPSSSAAKRGPMMGSKGKKHKSMPPGASSIKIQYPSGPPGRGQLGNRLPSGGLVNDPAVGASSHPHVGKKGLHALVYDEGTANETWEWVNLAEVERVFGANHPDPVEIEKAKKVLKEHEQALTDAISRIAELSDGESGARFLHGQAMERK
ncbi:hypothetical protein RD792_004401 [Penstemon davidsonii]|uniref:ENT domain-containing protein n=1 Tax=Penstemon davidsonii TaxID=160366 RepID=A0ABR0DHD0_9LAMI|nr:hypothetical protein RD792_004401 [Penstemon davidsonii]